MQRELTDHDLAEVEAMRAEERAIATRLNGGITPARWWTVREPGQAPRVFIRWEDFERVARRFLG